jgi:hypothetical protein
MERKPRPKLSVAPSGLIVVRESLTPELRKERREDNKEMARIRKLRKGRMKHGRHRAKPKGH